MTVTGEDGNEETWEIRAGSLYTLTRGGVSGDSFEPGQQVRVVGQVSTRRDNILLANNVLLPDGREVVLNGGAEPFQRIGRSRRSGPLARPGGDAGALYLHTRRLIG